MNRTWVAHYIQKCETFPVYILSYLVCILTKPTIAHTFVYDKTEIGIKFRPVEQFLCHF